MGIGEAAYSIIAPTIIADMFTQVIRSRVLMFFYFAIPVGRYFVPQIFPINSAKF